MILKPKHSLHSILHSMHSVMDVQSLWPHRHVKRHEAIARDMHGIEQRLTSIENGVNALAAKLDYIVGVSTCPVSSPPGLPNGKVENSEVAELNLKIDQLACSFAVSVNVEKLWERLGRLEALVVCAPCVNPSVDDVIGELLARKTSDSSAKTASLREPDAECSPSKPIVTDASGLKCDVITGASQESEFDVEKVAKVLEFDISDEVKNAEVQTVELSIQPSMSKVHKVCDENTAAQAVVAMVSQAVQTQARARNRNCRCQGRATQTDTVPEIVNSHVQANLLPSGKGITKSCDAHPAVCSEQESIVEGPEPFLFNGRCLGDVNRACLACGSMAMTWNNIDGATETPCACEEYRTLERIQIKDAVFMGSASTRVLLRCHG